MPSKFPKPGQSLADLNPEAAAQADGWDPTTIHANSNKKFSWKCSDGHTWMASPNGRARGSGCPYCSNKKVLPGYNDLATTNPELALQADGWDPTTLTANSRKKVGWRCVENHTWISNLDNRSKGNGCPICSGNQVLAGYNDLATINPELAAQADGWDPTQVQEFTHKKVWWRCNKNHSWQAAVADRSNGKGCPICSNNQVLVGYNDLATTNPELAAQAHGWDPTTMTSSSSKKVWWQCKKGHKWDAAIYSRTNGNQCPVCANQRVLIGYNDLATTNPELAVQADGWDPTTLTAHSNKRVGWRCEEGHTWKTKLNHRSNGIGCPSCAASGFDPNKDGWLYFLRNDEFEMFQIGISNVLEKRLKTHAKGGWEVIEVRGPMDGHLTQQLETAILHAVERRGAVLGHKSGILKFDGYSEAWTKDSLQVTSFKQLLDWVYEDDFPGK